MSLRLKMMLKNFIVSKLHSFTKYFSSFCIYLNGWFLFLFCQWAADVATRSEFSRVYFNEDANALSPYEQRHQVVSCMLWSHKRTSMSAFSFRVWLRETRIELRRSIPLTMLIREDPQPQAMLTRINSDVFYIKLLAATKITILFP